MRVGCVGLGLFLTFLALNAKNKVYAIVYTCVGFYRLFIYLCRVGGVLVKVLMRDNWKNLGEKPYNPTQPYTNTIFWCKKIIYYFPQKRGVFPYEF